MSSLTFGQAKSRLLEFAPRGEIDDRLNLVVDKLMTSGNYKGVFQRALFSVTDGILTLPRHFETCFAASVENVPRPIYGHWYEYILGGVGVLTESNGSVIDRGEGYCTFVDPPYTSFKVQIVADLDEDALKTVTLYGLLPASTEEVWHADHRGEKLVIAAGAGGVTSANTFSSLSQVSKMFTRGKIRLYAVNPTDAGDRTLVGLYEPSEETPNYRRYLVPTVACSGGDGPVTVVAHCRRRFVPMECDDDLCPIDSLSALQHGLQSLNYHILGDEIRGAAQFAEALAVLNRQLSHNNGPGTSPLRVRMIEYGWSGMDSHMGHMR